VAAAWSPPTVVVSSVWGPVASSPGFHRLGRYAITAIVSTAVVVYDPGLVDPEHRNSVYVRVCTGMVVVKTR
jgi:hypothetical protein